MALLPRHGRRRYPVRGAGRFSLCRTRVARRDRHPSAPPPPRYAAIFTGATLLATILAALAVWPRDTVTLPGIDVAGASAPFVARYTMEDAVSRMH